MVHLRAVTPALAQLLDTATRVATADSGPDMDAVRSATSDFLDDRLRALVHTQTPSQLENALWIYLIAQRQLLTRAEKPPAPSAPPTGSEAGLPVPLHLPPCITSISDAVQWYCGELTVPTDATAAATTADAPAVSSNTTTAAASPASSSLPPKGKSTFRLRPEPQPTPAEKPGARLDELLRQRQRQQPPPPPPPPSADPAPAAAPRAAASGPLATVELALSALAQPKRASALRQPRTLRLLVRNYASVWGLVYLCRNLRRHTLRKERLLTGAATGAAGVKHGSGAGADADDAAPLAVCFHDYDLLLPWDLVQQVLGQQAGSISVVSAHCRAIDAASAESAAATRPAAARAAPIAIIINPAVTQVEDNPDRLRKNARVDAIDAAANKYLYALLSTHAHGQTSGRGGAGAGPSGNSAASAASAAPHQEALRSSLATVDLGEYGVLDPSRMRAPSSLSGGMAHAAAAGVGSSGALAGTSESAARSYALFLRDASIGFDIQVMAFSGAGVGYYLGYLRGLSSEWCTLYAVVGLVTMMLVDAVLLMIRVGRQDEAVLKARKRIRRQREKLEKEGERLVQTMQAAAAGAGDATPTAVLTDAAAAGHAAGKATPDPAETDALTKKKQ